MHSPVAASTKLDVVFERSAVIPGVLIMLVNTAVGSVMTFGAIFATEQGIGSASVFFVLYAVMCAVSPPGIGKLVDARGFRWPAILSTLGVVLTFVIVSLSANMVMLGIAGVFAGLSIGTATSVFNTMAVAHVGAERHGVAMSTFFVLFDFGVAAGGFVGGLIANAVDYSSMFLIMTLFPLVACLISAFTIKAGQADYAK